jgi:hypothetical protein
MTALWGLKHLAESFFDSPHMSMAMASFPRTPDRCFVVNFNFKQPLRCHRPRMRTIQYSRDA